MSKFEKVMKWSSVILLGICILLSVIIITNACNDYSVKDLSIKLNVSVQRSNYLAAALHDLNEIITSDEVSRQVNQVLLSQGYSGLVKEIATKQPEVVGDEKE